MANHGVQIINNNNDIIIDGENLNLVVHESGSLTTSSFAVTTSFNTSWSLPPVIAINVDSSGVWMARYEIDNNDNFTGVSFQSEHSSVSFNYCVANILSSGTSTNYGMQIWNSNGELVFDTGWRLLLLKDIVSFSHPLPRINDNANSRQYLYKTHASIANPYYVVSNNCITTAKDWDLTNIMCPQQLGMRKNSSTQLEVGYDTPDNWGNIVWGYSPNSDVDTILNSTIQVLVCELSY